jgi:hypothetical protein
MPVAALIAVTEQQGAWARAPMANPEQNSNNNATRFITPPVEINARLEWADHLVDWVTQLDQTRWPGEEWLRKEASFLAC